MSRSAAKIYVQPLLVGSEPRGVFHTVDTSGPFTNNITVYADSGASCQSDYTAEWEPGYAPESGVMRAFSSVPVIFPSELVDNYCELGNALREMSEAPETDDEWRIEQPVYIAARFFATGLMANCLPAPRVFNHGPKSVVFNWESNSNNLYLTVSADKLSVLISTPQRIERRIEISYSLLHQCKLLEDLLAPQFGEWVQTGRSATSNPLESRLLTA